MDTDGIFDNEECEEVTHGLECQEKVPRHYEPLWTMNKYSNSSTLFSVLGPYWWIHGALLKSIDSTIYFFNKILYLDKNFSNKISRAPLQSEGDCYFGFNTGTMKIPLLPLFPFQHMLL